MKKITKFTSEIRATIIVHLLSCEVTINGKKHKLEAILQKQNDYEFDYEFEWCETCDINDNDLEQIEKQMLNNFNNLKN